MQVVPRQRVRDPLPVECCSRALTTVCLRVRAERPRRSRDRAARALLGWSQDKLARIAGIGLTTLQRVEQNEGLVKGNFSTVLKIQNALEEAGIIFTDNEPGQIGVHLRTKKGSDKRGAQRSKNKEQRDS